MNIRKLTIMFIPEGVKATKQVRVPQILFNTTIVGVLVFSLLTGYILMDYFHLLQLQVRYQQISSENNSLKGEARLLMDHLDDVKRSLQRVQDYSSKLGEITRVSVQKVSEKTGIGPLSESDFSQASGESKNSQNLSNEGHFVPLGLNIDSLNFRPIFSRMAIIGREANQNAIELQQLLSTLSQQKSLLSSIPSIPPVDGWITSGYGSRISPFTGQSAHHMGIDIAAPSGTAVRAPADGVVIFSGTKEGFGNFVMIAHGYGIVSRFGHNAQNLVQPGQKILRGEQIGTVGSTGRTTGPHVHYEIQVNGQYEDPQKFILDTSDLRIY